MRDPLLHIREKIELPFGHLRIMRRVASVSNWQWAILTEMARLALRSGELTLLSLSICRCSIRGYRRSGATPRARYETGAQPRHILPGRLSRLRPGTALEIMQALGTSRASGAKASMCRVYRLNSADPTFFA